ncbi:hypothetical protein [Streptomyces sp. NPDC017673]|uniref:hypothetical protein n=1 Tax=Streptomyces sp. NPDC017673 TaxID=3365005 RepID=UPI0037A0F246
MWAAGHMIGGGSSDDAFMDFRAGSSPRAASGTTSCHCTRSSRPASRRHRGGDRRQRRGAVARNRQLRGLLGLRARQQKRDDCTFYEVEEPCLGWVLPSAGARSLTRSAW